MKFTNNTWEFITELMIQVPKLLSFSPSSFGDYGCDTVSQDRQYAEIQTLAVVPSNYQQLSYSYFFYHLAEHY